MRKTALQFIAALALGTAATASMAEPVFYSTTDVSHWEVAAAIGGVSHDFSSFANTGFVTATAVTSPPWQWTTAETWISNNATANNGASTFLHFRQTFDLTGYDPDTAVLQFRLAWDDWGDGFSLNGGSLIGAGGLAHNLGSIISLSNGFVAGLNSLDFYVEGGIGLTDGMALSVIGFTALPLSVSVPEPASGALLLLGLGIMGLTARRRKSARD